MGYEISFPGLGFTFNVNPVAFTIGSFEFRWYGILIAVGFLLAFAYAMKLSKRYGVNQDHLIDCIIAGLVLGIIGARLYYVLFYPGDMYWKDPVRILYINEGGLAIYGGLIGGLLGGLIMAKIHKMKIPAVLDIAVQGFLVGQGIGRWGNFLNQEAFGTNTDLPWGMYSAATENYLLANKSSLEAAGMTVNPSMPVHPTFLYESLWCLLGVLVLYLFSKKLQKYHGQVFFLYLIWYGVERFVVEGMRTDSLMVGSFRVSQLLAAATAVAGVILLIVFRNKGRVEEEYVPVYARPQGGEGEPESGEGVSLETAEESSEEREDDAETEEAAVLNTAGEAEETAAAVNAEAVESEAAGTDAEPGAAEETAEDETNEETTDGGEDDGDDH